MDSAWILPVSLTASRLEILPEEEKYHGLEVLMKHYREEEVSFDSSVMAKTVVMKLLVEQVSGKAHR